MATTDQVAKVQAVINALNIANDTIIDAIQMADIPNGTLVNTGGGVITINGRSLSNAEYCRIGQALGITW